MKREGLTFTVIFLAESANYGEGIGNISSLKKMTRGKCTTYLGHCRNVFASMLSMNAERKWTSCGKHWTTGSRNRDIEKDACCRRHTSNAVSQTVDARCCPPAETSNTGQRGVRRLPKRHH